MTNKSIKVGILGASGYTGSELIRLILKHPNLNLEFAAANNNAGQKLNEIFPYLYGTNDIMLKKWEDLNWNLDQVAESITDRTVAVFSSPVLGNPYDVDRLVEICNTNNIKLIADNCDSLGSKWKGDYLTEKAVAASCSFYPAHHICTIEGGMVSSNIKEIVDLARSYAWWGRGCYCVGQQNLLSNGVCGKRFSNWLENDTVVDHKYVFGVRGYNLKPLDLQGSVGSVQLLKFDEIHSLRRSNKERIQKALESIDGVRVVNERPDAETSWFGVPIVCEDNNLKRSLVAYLEENKIQTRNYFAGNILLHPGYRDLGNASDYPNANQVLDKVFFLGCSPTINEKMLTYIEKLLIGNVALGYFDNGDRYEETFSFINKIDSLSLSTGKSININLIKKVLNK